MHFAAVATCGHHACNAHVDLQHTFWCSAVPSTDEGEACSILQSVGTTSAGASRSIGLAQDLPAASENSLLTVNAFLRTFTEVSLSLHISGACHQLIELVGIHFAAPKTTLDKDGIAVILRRC